MADRYLRLEKSLRVACMLFFVALICFSCGGQNKRIPAPVYMPDMYYSLAYEPYAEAGFFFDKMSARLPVKGTIKRGYIPYEIEDTGEGYTLAMERLKNPYASRMSQKDVELSKELFGIYCASCHGEKGDGNGFLVQVEKILGVPSYSKTRLPDITEGSIFHVITYGKGVMGSHASQLTQKERWFITAYVASLRSKLD